MAAACAFKGWDPDYRSKEHPLQKAILKRLRERLGDADAISGQVIDGCGVPCFVLQVQSMALLWSQLAAEMAQAEPSLLGKIGRAMNAEPFYASGSDQLDGVLVRAAREGSEPSLVAKIGAEGLLCIALPGRQVGFALKIHSGRDEARGAAIGWVLENWFPDVIANIGSVLAPFTEIRNIAGDQVGRRVICG